MVTVALMVSAEGAPACDPLAQDADVSCIETALVARAEAGDAAGSFAMLREIRERRSDASDCYLLAHRIGEAAARAADASLAAIENDPSAGMCSGGYFYGAAGALDLARIGDDVAIRNACARGPLAQRIGCAKGIGSRLHHETGANITLAFDRCDDGASVGSVGPMSAGVWRDACYEGVMHDALMPLHLSVAADPSLHGVTKETAPAFCEAFDDGDRRDACRLGAWPLFADTLTSGEAIRAYCDPMAAERQSSCRAKMYRVLGWRFPDDMARIAGICESASAESLQCYDEASKEFIRNIGMQTALMLCQYRQHGSQDECVRIIADNGRLFATAGSVEREQLCKGLAPEASYACLSVTNEPGIPEVQ